MYFIINSIISFCSLSALRFTSNPRFFPFKNFLSHSKLRGALLKRNFPLLNVNVFRKLVCYLLITLTCRRNNQYSRLTRHNTSTNSTIRCEYIDQFCSWCNTTTNPITGRYCNSNGNHMDDRQPTSSIDTCKYWTTTTDKV